MELAAEPTVDIAVRAGLPPGFMVSYNCDYLQYSPYDRPGATLSGWEQDLG
jgi:hypothetical protein